MTLGVFDESLLILSDVHLGNDLNDLTQADAEGRVRRSADVDADLVNLLVHYRRTPPSGRRWRLIIAGDFIDFIGMAILPQAGDIAGEQSEEERAHGLGNGADHGRLKLRAVAARHPTVFEALADFVAEGHAVTIVHGNHDVEFHWDAVKEELRSTLAELAVRAGIPPSSDFASRIDFAPWFYYVGGVAYVEHGHQYDTLCSTEHVMAPLSPRDPRRIARSFSDVLLRWVVRPTHGVSEYGHHRKGLFDYVLLGARLGVGGLVRLFCAFLSAVVELFRLRSGHLSEAARACARSTSDAWRRWPWPRASGSDDCARSRALESAVTRSARRFLRTSSLVRCPSPWRLRSRRRHWQRCRHGHGPPWAYVSSRGS